MGLLACTLVVSLAPMAMAEVPDLDLSLAETAATEQVSLFNLPGGGGMPFTMAFVFGGSQMDASITLTLVNEFGDGIEGYAAEDLWLETDMGGLVACADGTIADYDTDTNGQTMWVDPLSAGGYTNPAGELTVVMVSGDALTQPGLDIQYNSADISGDGVANITDIANFTQILFGAYDFKADFVWDGVVNISDVALMTQGNGSSCD
jgi:hypothetical protein